MRSPFMVLWWELRDRWLFGASGVKAFLGLCLYGCLRFANRVRALRVLMWSHRQRPSPALTQRVRRELPAIQLHMDALIEPPWFDDLDEVARRAIVLKEPVEHADGLEKGVLLISFTFNFPYFHHRIDVAALLARYHLVLEPSWSDYCQPSFLFWTRFSEPVVVEASEPRDRRFLLDLGSNLVPVPFGASDWVDFRLFRPLPDVEKEFDVVAVGSLDPRKRYHVLLRALRERRALGLSAALVCHGWGGKRQELWRLVESYGVADRVSLFVDLPPEEVNRVLNRARCSVLLSRQEGSNRSLFEGMFAGLPAILLRSNIGVNQDYVNPQTGLLIEERELAESILHFREGGLGLRPREWAMEHISPLVTTRKLADVLRHLAPRAPWTRELAPKVNRPEVGYYDIEDERRLPAAREVLAQYLRS